MGSIIGKGLGRQAHRLGALGGATSRRKLQRQLGPAASFAQERVVQRLDAGREQLAGVLDVVAGGLENATRRFPDPISRRAFQTGGRFLRDASSRLQEESGEALVRQAQKAVREHPAVAVAGLFGAGMLAGRVLRASGLMESAAGRRT